MGIPTHPDGEHSKAGCRIGDRLDIVDKQKQDEVLKFIKWAHCNDWNLDGYMFREPETWDQSLLNEETVSITTTELYTLYKQSLNIK